MTTKPKLPEILDLYTVQPDREMADILKSKTLAKNPNRLICPYETGHWLSRFITVNEDLIYLKKKISILAAIPDSVLITGESGVGKELIARALHGDRSGYFTAINCTSLPSELLESELFGHKKGAFTGATEDRAGKFMWAQNGTVFLDEIGDMPVDMQAKLLRLLQERVVTPLGDNKEYKINCRVIAATNNPEIENPAIFRPDLYMRLATFTCHIDSLKTRMEDIQPIIQSLNIKAPAAEMHSYLADNPSALTNRNVRLLQSIVRQWEVFGSYTL